MMDTSNVSMASDANNKNNNNQGPVSSQVLLLPNSNVALEEDKYQHSPKLNTQRWQVSLEKIERAFSTIPRFLYNITGQNFSNYHVDKKQLQQKAFNYRWATVPPDVIPLTAADSDFPIAKPIRDAMTHYISQGYMNYGPAKGLPSLRSAIAKKRDIDPNCVFITDSAASAMFLVAQHCLSPGDEVLLSDPVDFLFQRAIENVGGVVVRYSLKPPTHEAKRWSFSVSDILPLITTKSKMIAICNPHNPVGTVWTEQEISELCSIASQHNLLLWSDEVWADVSYVPFTPTAIIARALNVKTFTVIGFSKGYALAGLRVGAILCPQETDVETISRRSLAEDTGYGVSVVSQIAAQAALEKGFRWHKRFKEHLKSQSEYCTKRLNTIPYVSSIMPEGTFVCFADVSYYVKRTGWNEEALVQYLVTNYRVAVVPGSPRFFGPSAAGHIRISVATSRKILRDGLNRLSDGLRSLI